MKKARSPIGSMLAIPLFAALVVLVFVLARRTDTGNEQAAEATPQPCVATHADGRMEGILTAQFDDEKNLTGWRCTMMVHMNCTAGPDGVWTSCDYPPDMGWPAPVPREALDNPSLYAQDAQPTP